MARFIVYKVTSPSGKCYIGITSKKLQYRKRDHILTAETGRRSSKFQKAILKYKDNLMWEIIKEVEDRDTACELEQYYINKYNSYDNGYNCTTGGDYRYNWKMPQKTKDKISKKLKNRNKTEVHKKALSEGQNRYRSDIKNREKMAIERGSKPFDVYNKDTREYIGTWINKAECARELNVRRENIRMCLQNKRNFTSSFIFKYKEQNCGS